MRMIYSLRRAMALAGDRWEWPRFKQVTSTEPKCDKERVANWPSIWRMRIGMSNYEIRIHRNQAGKRVDITTHTDLT